jgi:transposase InsO family protein
LRFGFVYLAVLLDAFSRRGIGWALGMTLEGELTVAALRMALLHRQPQAGLNHHSDGGVQYAARKYVELLHAREIRPSMSRPGMPTDNATCERFIRTLKQGEVYLRDYDDFYDAQRSIDRFIDVVYNHKRLHSALGYVPPAEFERSLDEPLKGLALT